jgi:hypothetical protein
MARWRFLKTSFAWWFGLIWTVVGVGFLAGGGVGLIAGGAGANAARAEDAANESWWVLPLVFAGVGLLAGGIGFGVLARALVACRRHVQLLRGGLAAIGQVVAVEENLRVRINHRHPHYLRYQFTDALGQTQVGCSQNLPRALEQRYAPGEKVVVLYDPNDPTRHTVDLYGEYAAAREPVEAR